jgi:rubrerythrin
MIYRYDTSSKDYGGTNMLSKIPIDLERIKKGDLDREILRSAIIAELDAINLYEQMADMTQNRNIRKLLLDVAREEKTHVGEFQVLLLIEDKEQLEELGEGKKEVKELLGKGK